MGSAGDEARDEESTSSLPLFSLLLLVPLLLRPTVSLVVLDADLEVERSVATPPTCWDEKRLLEELPWSGSSAASASCWYWPPLPRPRDDDRLLDGRN